MRTRLRYLAILLVSALAIVVGIFPSVLSLGALLGIATGTVAILALIRPAWVESRTFLRRFALAGGLLLAMEIGALLAAFIFSQKRTLYLTVTSAEPRVVRIVYGVSDGDSSPWWRWHRHLTVRESGPLYTRLALDRGVYQAGDPHRAIAHTPDAIGWQHAGQPGDTPRGDRVAWRTRSSG